MPIPDAEPNKPQPREVSDRDLAILDLNAALTQLITVMLAENPTLHPILGARILIDQFSNLLMGRLPEPAITQGLLAALEARSLHPMTPSQIKMAAEALAMLSDERARAIAQAAGKPAPRPIIKPKGPGLILPPGYDQ